MDILAEYRFLIIQILDIIQIKICHPFFKRSISITMDSY